LRHFSGCGPPGRGGDYASCRRVPGCLDRRRAASSAAAAQAVIAGTVRDTSGAILPGVTVEASSQALIEKTRTAVSDGTGQYRIEDLRPGTYTVNFTLTGFSAFRREGVELTGSFTATINAEMRLGTLEETVTVTGESPIVDVQSARRQTVLSNDVLKAIPTVRSYNAMVVVVPGVVTNTNDVQTGTSTRYTAPSSTAARARSCSRTIRKGPA